MEGAAQVGPLPLLVSWSPPCVPAIEMTVCTRQNPPSRVGRRAERMADSCTHVYVHFVWATWNRVAFLTPELEERIYDCVTKKCEELRCLLLAIGGTEDHIHVLVRIHSLTSVGQLAHGMKGSSAHLTTHRLTPDQP